MDSVRGSLHVEMYHKAETPEERLAGSDPKNLFMHPSELGDKLKELIRADVGDDAAHMECGGGTSEKIELSDDALKRRAAEWPVSSVKAVLRRMELVLSHIMGVK